LWGDIQDTLQRTEIEWLDNVQAWSAAKIDQAVTSDANKAELMLLAFLHASNEVLFPNSLLDVPSNNLIGLSVMIGAFLLGTLFFRSRKKLFLTSI